MDLIIVLSILFKCACAMIAFFAARLSLSSLDKRTHFDFKSWIRRADDQAISIYLGCRILAICILFGWVIS